MKSASISKSSILISLFLKADGALKCMNKGKILKSSNRQELQKTEDNFFDSEKLKLAWELSKKTVKGKNDEKCK